MMNRRAFAKRLCLGLLLTTCVTGCGGDKGPKRYPVAGEVLINGEPTAGVMVQFEHSDPSVEGSYRFPTGVTAEDGSFALSSTGDADGAVEGNYNVTLIWLSSNDLSAYDLLGGKYSDKKAPPFQITVRADDNQLEPFELSIKEKEIKKKARPRGRKPEASGPVE